MIIVVFLGCRLCFFYDYSELEYSRVRQPEKKSAVRKLLRQNKVDVLLLKEFKIHKKKNG